jgi:hypothetical protein
VEEPHVQKAGESDAPKEPEASEGQKEEAALEKEK